MVVKMMSNMLHLFLKVIKKVLAQNYESVKFLDINLSVYLSAFT